MTHAKLYSDNNLGAFIENSFGDRFLYSINGSSFNRIGSHAVYQNLWGSELFKENTLYVFAGTDSGLLPRYIHKRGIPDGSRYLFIELDEVLPIIGDAVDEQAAEDKKMLVCGPSDWFAQAKNISFVEYAYLDSIELCQSVAVSDAHLLAYSELWRELEKDFQSKIWTYQKEFGTLTFLAKQIENLAENRYPAELLKGSFQGKTAVLLAGGPSLDRYLPWIQQNRNRVTLIAVSRISKRLLDVGLEPDIIVTVDPHQCSFDVSKHMLLFQSALLVSSYHATPLLLSQWRGRSLYLDSRFPWEEDKHNIKGKGPTVSNSALNLCIDMGFNQVILIGLDLCFSQEGYSHAKGSMERNKGAFVAYGTQTVMTNDGNIADTDTAFFNSIAAIEAQAKHAQSKGVRLINPSNTAARIQNVEYLDAEDIQLPNETINAKELITGLLPKENSDSRTRLYQDTLKQLDIVSNKISKLKKYAKDALKCNDGLFGRNGMKKDFKYKIKMDRIEKKIAKELPKLANIAKIFGMTEFVKTLRPDASREWTDEDIELTGKQFYNAYLHGAEKLEDVIKAQILRLNSRIEEEAETPDIESLSSFWQKENTPGRAAVWAHLHPEQFSALDAQQSSLLEKLRSEHQREIDNQNNSHLSNVNRYAELTPVLSKLQKLMHQKDIQGMKRLLQGLNTRTEEEALHLQKLVTAHIAECEENMQLAVELYRQLLNIDIDKHVRLIEAALIRLSFLSMNCGELKLAADCLKNLTDISFTYMPFYAEALRLSNQTQAAIDTYTSYLTQVQDDLASMMKLGILYKSLGVKEGAAWLFNYVYSKDPDNTAAKRLLDELELSA